MHARTRKHAFRSLVWSGIALALAFPASADTKISGRNSRDLTPLETTRVSTALNILACAGATPNLSGVDIGAETTPGNTTSGESDLDTILIPEGQLKSLSASELACVIAHEAQHITHRKAENPPSNYDHSTDHNTPQGFCNHVKMACDDVQFLCSLSAQGCAPVCCWTLANWIEQAQAAIEQCAQRGGQCTNCDLPDLGGCDCIVVCSGG